MGFSSVLFGQFGLKDLLDIFIVSLLVYQLIMITHGTRAVQMIFGLLFLVLLYLASVSYELYALNWLLKLFFDSFFVFFIILFQDQIRSALANFGARKSIWKLFNKEEINLEIEEIVESSFSLSQQGVGALIVFEREHGLMNYISTGTRLNSEVHSDLIFSLFQQVSPLHDGAIIVRQGKLAAAGCFLPLSKNINIDKHLGTRHRAALGVSEVSDAVVLIVSEETGKVSLCINELFYACDTEHQLRQYFYHLWAGKKLDKKLTPITKERS